MIDGTGNDKSWQLRDQRWLILKEEALHKGFFPLRVVGRLE